MNSVIRPTLVLFTALTLVTGAVYPLAVTGAAQLLFPVQAAGSLVLSNGHAVGSALIGQAFSDPGHFWGRPSATGLAPNNAQASGGSNLGPLNPALVEAVKGRVEALKAADPGNAAAVPIDLVTASASGLDPHISPAGAAYQLGRVARARKLPPETLARLVDAHTHRPVMGWFGEARVDVLELNLALDALEK